MNALLMPYLPLVALLTVAAATDVRARRIPNWICLALVLAGLTSAAVGWIVPSLGGSALGLALGLSIGTALLALGVWGAGDAKLFAAIGAWVGPMPLLLVFACAAVVSMCSAIAISIRRGRIGTLVRDGMMMGVAVATAGRVRAVRTVQPEERRVRGLPLAVPMLVATTSVLAWAAVRGRLL